MRVLSSPLSRTRVSSCQARPESSENGPHRCHEPIGNRDDAKARRPISQRSDAKIKSGPRCFGSARLAWWAVSGTRTLDPLIKSCPEPRTQDAQADLGLGEQGTRTS